MNKYTFNNYDTLWKKLLSIPILNGALLSALLICIIAFFLWAGQYIAPLRNLNITMMTILLLSPFFLLFRSRKTITLEPKKITVKITVKRGERLLSTPYEKTDIWRGHFTGWLSLRYTESFGNYAPLPEEDYVREHGPLVITISVDTRFPAYWLLWEEIIKRTTAANPNAYIDPYFEKRIEKLKAKYPDKKLEGTVEREEG